MKQRFNVLLIIGLLTLIAALFFYPKDKKVYKKMEGKIQGTTFHITYEYDKNKDLQPDIERLLHNFDMSLSTYIPNSIISRINMNDQTAEADELFIEVFNKSKEVYNVTNGAFDITVAPIINALGFGFTKGRDIDSSLIDSLLQFVGMDKVKLVGRKIVKSNPSVMLDVNALAQGYSVDIVCRFLDKKKSKNYIVEIGGEIRAKGMNAKGEKWRVGIDKPEEGNMEEGMILQAILSVSGKSLATSGNYRKFYIKNGRKYAHIINPKTGYPALSNLLSTSVLADDCITADAYATALMVFGLDKSKEFLESHKELGAILIYNDEKGNYKVYTTENMKSYIVKEIQ
jgi:FAD:protein FMN transferase